MKRELGHWEVLAEALLWLGHALVGEGNPQQAIGVYRESLRIRQELHPPELAMGGLAGMARASLALGDLPEAQANVDEILAHLTADGSLQGTWEPLRIYLSCVQILEAAEDPRGQPVLHQALELLQERSSLIPDPADRLRFLNEVPWHSELMGRGNQKANFEGSTES